MENQLSGLLALAEILLFAATKINLRKEKRLARRIVQTQVLLQTIIEDAERIFWLIENAEAQAKEYGEMRFCSIIRENFLSQLERVEELSTQIKGSDFARILTLVDKKTQVKLNSAFFRKREAVTDLLRRISHGWWRLESGQIFIMHEREKVPAFPNMAGQRKILEELDKCSNAVWDAIGDKVRLVDLK